MPGGRERELQLSRAALALLVCSLAAGSARAASVDVYTESSNGTDWRVYLETSLSPAQAPRQMYALVVDALDGLTCHVALEDCVLSLDVLGDGRNFMLLNAPAGGVLAVAGAGRVHVATLHSLSVIELDPFGHGPDLLLPTGEIGAAPFYDGAGNPIDDFAFAPPTRVPEPGAGWLAIAALALSAARRARTARSLRPPRAA